MILISRIILHWDNLVLSDEITLEVSQQVFLSIILPARNEAENIAKCLQAVQNQDYPATLLEIIVIDDQSTDDTANIISTQFKNVKLLSMQHPDGSNGSKKQALSKGIAVAKGKLIVCLDADCVPSSDKWLTTMVSCLIANRMLAVTGPVKYTSDATIWQNFQAIENAGMMVITGVGHQSAWFQMANGGNMCFYKSVFDAVNGFEGNAHLASGDDMFLFEKIHQLSPLRTGFVKNEEAIVETSPIPDFQGYIQQRIRWGTKNSRLQSFKLKGILSLVWIENLFVVMAIVSIPFIYNLRIQLTSVVLILLKFMLDFGLLKCGAVFLKQVPTLKRYWISALMYPFLLVFTGILSIFKTDYTWKGRKVK